jgi:hypothetical protein
MGPKVIRYYDMDFAVEQLTLFKINIHVIVHKQVANVRRAKTFW